MCEEYGELKNWFAIGHLMELFLDEWHLMELRHAEIIPFNPNYMWLLRGRLEISSCIGA